MKTLIAIALFLIAGTVSANSTKLYTEVSLENETADAFVQRIAQRMSSRTNGSGHEVCGVLQRVDNTYVLDVLTSNQPKTCFIPMVRAGEHTVHTHPRSASRHFGPGDYTAPGYLIHGRKITHQQGVGTERELTP